MPRDHPRACGEHVIVSVVLLSSSGSSPRMRGTLRRRGINPQAAGIIPAHAGNTVSAWPVHGSIRDHPRACGEHRTQRVCADTERGSSPRMRGTPWIDRVRGVQAGIIPAHAGNTNPQRQANCLARDHPRACGEHGTKGAKDKSKAGSSPRMRGTHDLYHDVNAERGIIPAHAGNTIRADARGSFRRDHPRACGEHPVQKSTALANGGSSPRMRGTRTGRRTRTRREGIIPAHAGNTSWSNGVRYRPRDHPRACGEHRPARGSLDRLRGSSPRMRGTRRSQKRRRPERRIIPAHAGNT